MDICILADAASRAHAAARGRTGPKVYGMRERLQDFRKGLCRNGSRANPCNRAPRASRRVRSVTSLWIRLPFRFSYENERTFSSMNCITQIKNLPRAKGARGADFVAATKKLRLALCARHALLLRNHRVGRGAYRYGEQRACGRGEAHREERRGEELRCEVDSGDAHEHGRGDVVHER